MTEPGIVAGVLDLSFRRFVVVRIVRWFYVLAIVAGAFAMVGAIVTCVIDLANTSTEIAAMVSAGSSIHDLQAASTHRLITISSLVMTPVAFLFWVLWARVVAECVVVVFRIAEALAAGKD